MKNAYLTLGFLIGLVAASLLFALIKPSGDDGGQHVTRMKVAHALPTTHPVHAGILHFAERLAVHSGGRFQIDVFPNGQLGSESQTLEQMQSGTLDMAKVGGAPLSSFVPVAKLFSLPYLFRNQAHYYAVLDGDVGRGILGKLSINNSGDSSGFHGLTYYDSGSRNFYAKKPILRPEDLKGLKIRVQNDPVAVDMITAMGGAPTPIAWGELYTALQQGVVDGAENNPPSYVTSRHFEVCKEFSFDHHSRVPDVLLISSSSWERLTEQEQGWFQKAAAESSIFQRAAWAGDVEKALALMQSKGVTVHEADPEPFMRATESVRAKYAVGEIKAIIDAIQQVSE